MVHCTLQTLIDLICFARTRCGCVQDDCRKARVMRNGGSRFACVRFLVRDVGTSECFLAHAKTVEWSGCPLFRSFRLAGANGLSLVQKFRGGVAYEVHGCHGRRYGSTEALAESNLAASSLRALCHGATRASDGSRAGPALLRAMRDPGSGRKCNG